MSSSLFVDPYLFQELSSIECSARFIVDSLLMGEHASLMKLGSSEFADYLEYSPGMDIRRIDWNVYARRDRLYVRHYHDERALRAFVVLDTSLSMDYAGPKKTLTKLQYSVLAGAALATWWIRKGDSVGFYYDHDTDLIHLPLSHGKKALPRVYDALERVCACQTSDMGRVLDRVTMEVSGRSLIVIFSDFLETTTDALNILGAIKKKGAQVVLVRILDPWEVTFPFEGECRFVDPESGEEVEVVGEEVYQSYMNRLEEFQAWLKKTSAHAGLQLHEVISTEPIAPVIRKLFAN